MSKVKIDFYPKSHSIRKKKNGKRIIIHINYVLTKFKRNGEIFIQQFGNLSYMV